MSGVKQKVLVTGTGAVIGYGILRALQLADLKVEVWASDADPKAVGFGFAHKQHVILRADDPNFVDPFLEFGQANGPALILPGIEQDVDRLMKERQLLTKAGFQVALPSEQIYRITNDKYSTFQFFSEQGLPVIPTCLLSEPLETLMALGDFPMIVKPRLGSGGKGIQVSEDRDSLNFWRSRLNQQDYIVQPLIGREDDEFTCGAYRTNSGKLLGPIMLRRKLGYGSTIKATSEYHPQLKEFVGNVLDCLAEPGPYCCQVRWTDGAPWLLEVNARLSSSTSIKALLGFNEPAMLVGEILFGQEPEDPHILWGKTVTRYLADSMS